MKVGEVNYYTHSSKTRCVFVDNKELPLISIDIWCKAGSSFEEVDKNGTAHFLEHMIFKGSNKIMPGEFDHKIESLGGLSNASTCLLYTSPSPRDVEESRMPSSA